HESGEGVVQRILPKNMLEISVDDFFEIEVHVSEVARIHSGENTLVKEAEAEKEQQKKKKGKIVTPEPPKRPAIQPPSVVIVQNPDRDYEIILLNPGGQESLFTSFIKVRHKFRPLNAALVPPQDQHLIAKFTPQEFHMAQMLFVQLLQYPRADSAKPIAPITREIRLKAEVFSRPAERIPELGQEGHEFVLQDKLPEPEVLDAEAADHVRVTAQRPSSQPSAPPEVVDLHIQFLVDNQLGLTADATLRIQLEQFERKITDGHLHKRVSMVFIHGVGSGVLKREIRNRLKNYAFVERHENADPIQYGNGATIVYFKGL
ncbi:MAG: Smr/MutS family protein, partial [Bacteroidota bacterium]